MEEQVMFSVVITAYNRGWCIERAIDSVLRQSIVDFEVVVSDDGSSDNTVDIVNQKYATLSGKVRCVQSDINKGMFHAQMLGVQSAKGRYVVFLDSDDELLPDALLNFANLIVEAPAINVYFQNFIDDNGNIKGQLLRLLDGKHVRIFNYRDMCRLFAIGDYLPCVNTNLLHRSRYFEPLSAVSAYTHNLWYNLFSVADVLYSNGIGGVVHLSHSDRRTKNQSNKAAAWLKGVEYFISRHGTEIRKNGGQMRKCYLDASRFAFQSEQRAKGIAYFTCAVILELKFRLLKIVNNF